MNNLSRALAVTLMAATIPATIVLAQQAPAEGEATVERGERGERGEGRRGPSPETLARLQDGRIAFAKEALKLTPEQEKLWAPVEEKIRAGFEEHRAKRAASQAKREERREKRGEQQAQDEDGKTRERLALPERMEKRSERLAARAVKMNERAAKAKEFADVLKPLYASFSDEQKTVAAQVLSRFGKEGRGSRGSRWAMDRGDHGGYGHGRGDR